VTADNAAAVVKAGANVLVAGSAVFKNNDATRYAANIAAIRGA
jgi:ribulose-phosphate 3-epimerase